MNYTLRNEHGQIVIKGRVGQDARFSAEHNVTNISFAVTRSWPDEEAEGGFSRKTAWYEAAVWGRTAESLAGLAKGDTIEVSFHAADVRADVWRNQDGSPKLGDDGDVRTVLKIDRCLVQVIEKKAQSESEYVAEPEPVEVPL